MQGNNFKSLQLEGMKDLEQRSFKHPLFDAPVDGHLFLKDDLGLIGSEIGIHRLKAYESMPYYHAHREHEETYIIYSGRGEFKIDGEVIPVSEGTIIHIEPKGIRTWRNTSQEPLYYICIQSGTKHAIQSDVKDGVAFSKKVLWE